MLVRLVENGGGSGNPVLVQTLSYSFDEISVEDRFRLVRLRGARKIINNKLDQDQKPGFEDHINHILTEELSFAAQAYVLHAGLSDLEFGERGAIIEDAVRAVAGPMDTQNPAACPITLLINRLHKISFLYPTVCLDMTVREACALAFPNLSREGILLSEERKAIFREPFINLEEGNPNRAVIEKFVIDAISYLSWDELAETGIAVIAILGDQPRYRDHVELLSRMFGLLHQGAFKRVRGRAVRAMVDADYDDYEETLLDLYVEANDVHEQYYADQLRIIYRMIDSDLPTRPIALAQRKLLTDLRKTAEAEARKVIVDVDASVEEDARRQQEQQAAEAQRLVSELLAGFREKPKSKGKQGTRAKKGAKRKKRNQRQVTPKPKIVVSRTRTTQSPKREDPVPGLKKYLEFVDFELEGMGNRLPDSNGVEERIEAIEGRIAAARVKISDALECEEPDAQSLTDLAREIDTDLSAFRTGITALTEHLEDIRGFEMALRVATQREPIEYGRAQGGQLRRRLGGLRWADISRHFHCRCLFNATGMSQGGITRLLMEDEALAYYVTSSSLSGYDFDISCHYWRRRPGSDAPPTDEDGYMNTDGWHDTLVPCFVLHVPL